MKIHDFGLWFQAYTVRGEISWSATIPQTGYFYIYYDSAPLGCQYDDFDLEVYTFNRFIIKLKNNFARNGYYYNIGRRLTLDDFEIVPNPDYKGDP